MKVTAIILITSAILATALLTAYKNFIHPQNGGAHEAELTNPEPSGTGKMLPEKKATESTRDSDPLKDPFSTAINPEKARRLLEEARKSPDIDQRAIQCSNVIRSLCSAGYVDEAWSLIDTESGIVRHSELFGFFSSAKLSLEELSEKMEQLPYEGEHSGAVGGYLMSLSLEEVRSLVKDKRNSLLALPGLNEIRLKNTIAGDLMNKIGGSCLIECDPVKALEATIDFHSAGWIDDYGLASVLEYDRSRDSFSKYQTLMAATDKPGKGDYTSQIRKAFIKDMVKKDADKSLDVISSTPGAIATRDLADAIEGYGIQAPVRANQWFLDNRSKLSQPQLDAVAAGFFKVALDDLEEAGATAWMNQIQDPDMKKKAGEDLSKRFKKETEAPRQNQ